MSQQTWEETLIARIADATQISNTVSETIMLPDTAIPANYFYAGRVLRVKLFGVISNVVTTPGTLTFRARWGGVGGTALVTSGALTQHTTAHTNAPFWIEFLIACRLAGSSGTLFTCGHSFRTNAATPSTAPPDVFPVEGTSGAVASLDLASAGTLSLTAQFSVSTSPTNLTVQAGVIESLN
jgi:hypothetical protein